VSTTGINPSADQPSLNYLNLQLGIRARYPVGWEKLEETGAAGFMVMFLSPPEGPSDQFRENVNVIVERIPAPVRLEDLVANNLRLIKQQMPVTDISQPQPVQLAGMPAYQVTYCGQLPVGGLPGKWLQIYTVKGSNVYTVTYTAETSKFEAFLGVMQKIIASLEIK
jgi:hypothetical protein